MSKRGLGRGLEALLPEIEVSDKDRIIEVRIEDITPNPFQPRRTFDEKKIEELAASIKQYGVLQPVILRQVQEGYQLVAGERRFRAAKRAGLAAIPAVIREILDERLMEIALIENVQREDLNPVDEAIAYDKIMTEYNLTQEDLADRIGKSRSQVANYVRLLQLDKEVLEKLAGGLITVGHAKLLVGMERTLQEQLTETIIEKQLSVRQLEDIVRNASAQKSSKGKKGSIENKFENIEDVLKVKMGALVKISYKNGKGKIEIPFIDDDELGRIVDVLIGEENNTSDVNKANELNKSFTV